MAMLLRLTIPTVGRIWRKIRKMRMRSHTFGTAPRRPRAHGRRLRHIPAHESIGIALYDAPAGNGLLPLPRRGKAPGMHGRAANGQVGSGNSGSETPARQRADEKRGAERRCAPHPMQKSSCRRNYIRSGTSMPSSSVAEARMRATVAESVSRMACLAASSSRRIGKSW